MSEELAQLQRAVEDILRAKQMRPLSTYSSPAHSNASSCSPGVTSASLYTGNSPSANPVLQSNQNSAKDAAPAIVAPPGSTTGQSPDRPGASTRLPMTRENSQESQRSPDGHGQAVLTDDNGKNDRPPFYDHYSSLHSASLSTNPMGSLYEVTRLRSLRSNSTTNVHAHSHGHSSEINESSETMPMGMGKHTAGPSGLSRHMSLSVENNDDDLISRNSISLEEAEELFVLCVFLGCPLSMGEVSCL